MQIQTPRPKWDDKLKEQFLVKFVKENYSDYGDNGFSDEDWKKIGIYQSLSRYWNYGWEVSEIARDLMYDGWSYSEIKELDDEKDLYWEAEKFFGEKLIEWVEQNSLTCPFIHGEKIKTPSGEVGTIVLTNPNDRYVKMGKVIVKLQRHIEETQRLQANGGQGESIGQYFKWEELEKVNATTN